MRSSLRIQLVLGTWLLLVVGLLPPFFYFGHTLREDMFAEARTHAISAMDVTRWVLKEQRDCADVPMLSKWATEFGKHTGIRFTYMVNGKVLVDSSMTPENIARFDDHSLRPEIIDATMHGSGTALRYSTTLERYFVYIAEPVQDFTKLEDGIVRIALPVSEKQIGLARMESGLLLAFLISLLASGLLSFFVTRPFLRTIEDLALTTQAIGQGEYSRRLRAVSSRELRTLVHAINGMAHNIESHMYSLEEQKGRLEAVFNGMCEGVMVLDVHGCITRINNAMGKIFPSMNNMIGFTPLEATMLPRLQQAVDKVRTDKKIEAHTMLLECSGERVFDVHIVPFVDASGRCMVLVFHDVSEKEKLERMRRDFVANVSHELKTPLTSIKGYSEALTEMPNLPEQQRTLFLETIARNADHMTKMVTSLLTLAKSEHKGEKKVLPTIDACQVLDDCFEEMQPAATDKEIKLVANYDEGLFILADEDGLAEVFRNLLDNAIKYSPVGSMVSISATITSSSVVFCVEDQGAGVPRKSKDRIFERFFRLEGESSKHGSAGLGLAICRRIIKSYDGEIWVESPMNKEQGSGAGFFVSIPMTKRVIEKKKTNNLN